VEVNVAILVFSILVGSVSSYIRVCIANVKLWSVLSKY
jgi:hypothetical protein